MARICKHCGEALDEYGRCKMCDAEEKSYFDSGLSDYICAECGGDVDAYGYCLDCGHNTRNMKYQAKYPAVNGRWRNVRILIRAKGPGPRNCLMEDEQGRRWVRPCRGVKKLR